QEDPKSPDGLYTIAPDFMSTFKVYCDQTTDGGAWTVVSINGDLAQSLCRHRLRSDAPTCGTTPGPTSDWQLAGNLMDRLLVGEILFYDYTLDANSKPVFSAGTRLALPAYQVGVQTGNFTVTPS